MFVKIINKKCQAGDLRRSNRPCGDGNVLTIQYQIWFGCWCHWMSTTYLSRSRRSLDPSPKSWVFQNVTGPTVLFFFMAGGRTNYNYGFNSMPPHALLSKSVTNRSSGATSQSHYGARIFVIRPLVQADDATLVAGARFHWPITAKHYSALTRCVVLGIEHYRSSLGWITGYHQ